MHLAAAGGHFELMMMLLDNGGSLEDEDKVSVTSMYLINTYSVKQPDLYYSEAIKMTSQSKSNFIWRVRGVNKYS